MKVAYFDAISGAAGDMILGALLDAGLSLEALTEELRKLPLGGYRLRCERVDKRHIAATQFLVEVQGEDHHHHQETDHGTPREAPRRHPGGTRPARSPRGYPGRSLRDIQDLIRGSGLSRSASERALEIFRRLGEAEARVHGVGVEEVHFHEVGAVDSIVDIVGAAVALDLLEIERVYCSPLPMGSGSVRTAHGIYPIPAPATLELVAAARAPVVPSTQNAEQVTPTGAAILTTVARFELPPMTVERIGYGSGEADLSVPNVLRVWIGQAEGPAELHEETVAVLETNIDDLNPEVYGYVLDRLFEAGALDALLTPVIMKKGRPGVKLEVLCRPEDERRMTEILFDETSTLGIRVRTSERHTLEREVIDVSTPYGTVAVKVKLSGGRGVAVAPEYEDCRRLAAATGAPLIEIYGAAAAAGRELLSGRPSPDGDTQRVAEGGL